MVDNADNRTTRDSSVKFLTTLVQLLLLIPPMVVGRSVIDTVGAIVGVVVGGVDAVWSTGWWLLLELLLLLVLASNVRLTSTYPTATPAPISRQNTIANNNRRFLFCDDGLPTMTMVVDDDLSDASGICVVVDGGGGR
jgi:hypothetical protein